MSFPSDIRKKLKVLSQPPASVPDKYKLALCIFLASEASWKKELDIAAVNDAVGPFFSIKWFHLHLLQQGTHSLFDDDGKVSTKIKAP